MSTRPFCNNLAKNDRVFDTVSKKHGTVFRQVNEDSRSVCVLFDGNSTSKYVDVMRLRIVLNGKVAEDVPPIDGEPPLPDGDAVAAPKPRRASTALESLIDQRTANIAELANINLRFTALKAENEKIDRAIDILKS